MEPDRKVQYREPANIPEDFIYHKILPQLPCKVLSRFKVVSKAYGAMISDSQFSTLQAISPSPLSTGFVYMEEQSGLSFLSDLDTVGVPDPTLKFMVKSPGDAVLLSSTNGLLLLSLFGDEQSDLCVCNPATMEKHILPKGWNESRPECMGHAHMGLAFDPRTATRRYAVVDALHEKTFGGTKYTFNVFQSQTGAWKISEQEIHIPRLHIFPLNPVYAQGILYWDCMYYLIWFDPEKDCSGKILLPHYEETESVRKFIEVFKDEEICCMCMTSEGGIEVWILTGGAQWERKYELNMKKLIHESPNNLYFGLPDAEMMYPFWIFVTPLAFDGRNVYAAVASKDLGRVRALATSENMNAFDEYALLPHIPYEIDDNADNDCEANSEEELFCFDMVTGKVTSTSKSMIRTERNYRILHYRNSMVILPPILK